MSTINIDMRLHEIDEKLAKYHVKPAWKRKEKPKKLVSDGYGWTEKEQGTPVKTDK
jgi:hypothetical protein